MSKTAHSAPDGPPPAGPYSPAVGAGGMVFLSGQLPLDAAGDVAGSTAVEQARVVLDNMRSLLAEAGLGMDDVVKTTIFLADMGDFAAVNGLYGEYFTQPYPARSTIQVGALPKGAQVEIEAIALRQN